jgi:hypothetical protein
MITGLLSHRERIVQEWDGARFASEQIYMGNTHTLYRVCPPIRINLYQENPQYLIQILGVYGNGDITMDSLFTIILLSVSNIKS